MSTRWHPVCTDIVPRPQQGQLLAHDHGVWRVEAVEDVPLSDADREKWVAAGRPDLATWPRRPYRVRVKWIGGHRPEWVEPGRTHGEMVIPVDASILWQVYKGHRWPMCSCCGEPMPCRSELEDQQVAQSMAKVTRMESILDGACWACGEPITTRQESVTYPGDNLDLPGAPEPRFHTRSACRRAAEQYEERWLAADPRHERILTWPPCGGLLIVHQNGDSECVEDRSRLAHIRRDPECRGHDTHDHTTVAACYISGACPRGCTPHGHPGTVPRPRPERHPTRNNPGRKPT